MAASKTGYSHILAYRRDINETPNMFCKFTCNFVLMTSVPATASLFNLIIIVENSFFY